MVKRYLNWDEWYPVLSLREEFYDWDKQPPAEFTEEELADLCRVGREFKAWQKKIAERFGKPDPLKAGDLDQPLAEKVT